VQAVERGESLPDHLVSIGNPRLPWKQPKPGEFLPPVFRGRFRRILRLAFFDCIAKDNLGELRPRRIPTKHDVRRLIRFWRRTHRKTSGYTVHCWGGISRSSAVALGLLYLELGDEAAAARHLVAQRPQAGPHPLILRFFDELLGSHLAEAGETIRKARFAEWRRVLNEAFPDAATEPEELSPIDEDREPTP
jgi:predicted protein tyrosine phosphatase